jgi:hypothetical protein
MAKKLTASALKSSAAKKFTKKKVILDINGNNYKVLVDTYIKPTDLEKLFEELKNNAPLIEAADPTFDISNYTNFLLVKYMTDLDVPAELDKQLELFYHLVNLQVMDKILENIDADELTKLFPVVTKKYLQSIVSKEFVKQNADNPEAILDLVNKLGEVSDEVTSDE